MSKIDAYKEYIYDSAMEKQAGLLTTPLTTLAKGAIGAVKSKGLATAAKDVYNVAAKTSLAKKVGTGALLGAAVGANKYNAATDDGSFGKSRLGTMLGGAAGGAALGGAAHLTMKPIGPKIPTLGAGEAPKLLPSPTGATPPPPKVNVTTPGGTNTGVDPNMFGGQRGPIIDADWKAAASQYVYERYEMMQKEASAKQKVIETVEKIRNAKPGKRLLVGGAAGAGLGLVVFKPRKKDENAHDDDDDGLIASALKNSHPAVKKAIALKDKAMDKLDTTYGGSVAKGAIVGSALAYTAGRKKY